MSDNDLHQGQSIFDTPVLDDGLMPLQADVTVPQSTSLASATGMLVPDVSLAEQLRHFPEEIYDLRPTSHLVRLMQALLGESGVGQLRKRLLLAQLQSLSASGARFFDLDRFYGALFGASRTPEEQLPVNPMEDSSATAPEWDAIEGADASFRDRMTALVQAVAMGGTLPGLRAAAEAVTGAEADVFESWALLEAAENPEEAGHDWAWMESGVWADYEGRIWGALEGVPFYGRSGTLTRGELLVRVNRDYELTPEGQAQRVRDEHDVVRVLSRLMPAHILLTVEAQGGSAALEPRAIAGAVADSEHWEVEARVTPTQTLAGTEPYPLSPLQAQEGVDAASPRVLPRPPLTARLGNEWVYGLQAPTCRTYSFLVGEADFTEPGSVPDTVNDRLDQTIVWRDGTSTEYGAALGVMDPVLSMAARAGRDGVLVANAYSGDRRTVPPTD